MRIAVRTAVSSRRGAGHLTRCIALLQGVEDVLGAAPRVSLVLDPDFREREALVRDAVRELGDCRVHDAHDVALGDLQPLDWIIVDHYDLGADYETTARQTGARILAIDDLVRAHDADIVVDQTLGRTAAKYAGKVPRHCRVLAGTDHALLRRPFRLARAVQQGRARTWHTPRRILVSLGLSERTGLAARIVRVLAALPIEVEARVVTSATDPHLAELATLAAARPDRIAILTDVDDMCGLMGWADLAIGAAGVTTWERLCLGLPSIVMQTADNQAEILAAISRTGAVRTLDCRSDDEQFNALLGTAVSELAGNALVLSQMSSAATKIVDGKGITRVGCEMIGTDASRQEGIPAGHDFELTIRPASMDDAKLLLEWRNDEVTRAKARSGEVISPEDHMKWLEHTLEHKDRLLLIALPDLGTIRLDRYPDFTEASWTVAPKWRGRGVGKLLVSQGLRFASGLVIANIKPGNWASQKIAEGCGMRLSGTNPEGLLQYKLDLQSRAETEAHTSCPIEHARS